MAKMGSHHLFDRMIEGSGMTGIDYFQRDQVGNWFGDYKRTSCGLSERVRSGNDLRQYASNDDYPLHNPHLAKCYKSIRENMIWLADAQDARSLAKDDLFRQNAMKWLEDLLDECKANQHSLTSVAKKLPLREATFLRGFQSIIAGE